MERLVPALKKYICMSALTLLVLTAVLQLWNGNIRQYPLYNEADGLLSQFVVRANIEGGVTKTSFRAGFPFGNQLSDFPVFMTHLYSNTFYKAASVFTHNWIFIENLHFIISFLLVAVITFFILEKAGIFTPIAMLGSLLYTFLPWHFIRTQMGHFSYLDYFVCPIILFYVLQLSEGTGIFKPGNHYRNWHNILTVLGLLLCGSVNIYFSFFSCLFLAVSILFNLYSKKITLCLQALSGILVIGVENLAFLFPWLQKVLTPGTGYLSVYRNPAELRTYALNISSMLLPVENHRFTLFSGLRDYFTESYGTPVYDALGLFAAAGAVTGIFLLFRKETEGNKRIKTAAVILTASIFVACTGGLNELIGMVFGSIRAYTRISIFIAFLAIFIMMYLLNELYTYVIRKKHVEKLVWTVCLMAMAAGVADQTTKEYIPDYSGIEEECASDREFMKKLDFDGSVVFQLPYVSFPEMPPVGRMKDYEQLKGYLYSDKAVFSYGAMKDSAGDRWCQWVVSLPMEEQLLVMAASGFNGIYIDSYAYQEEELDRLTGTLTEMLACEPEVSRNKRLFYYSMQTYLEKYEQQYTQEEKEYLKNLFRKVTGFRLKKGFYEKQMDADGKSFTAGAGKKAVISLYNADKADAEVVIRMKLKSADGQKNSVRFQCNGYTQDMEFDKTVSEYSIKTVIPPGTTNISLLSPETEIRDEQNRQVCFYLTDFELESKDSYAVVAY